MDVAGMETTAACPAFAYTAEETATVIRRLEGAGAVLIGKTNMDQFATGLVGVRSPYGACSSVFDADYISGGSSSGSAVAVASGLVSFALGTDTAGSGRVPAAFNNLIGLKPTRGSLSAAHIVPACRSLDCVSVFALTAGDARQVFEAARGFDEADPYSRPSAGEDGAAPWLGGPFRFGVPQPDQWEFFGDEEARKAVRGVHPRSRVAGRRRRALRLPPVPGEPPPCSTQAPGWPSGRPLWATSWKPHTPTTSTRSCAASSRAARGSAPPTASAPSTAWKHCGGRRPRLAGRGPAAAAHDGDDLHAGRGRGRAGTN